MLAACAVRRRASKEKAPTPAGRRGAGTWGLGGKALRVGREGGPGRSKRSGRGGQTGATAG